MNRIKEIRMEKGLKQKDIAAITELSKSSISLIENGKARPSMNSAFKIAKALGVTIECLFIFDYEDKRGDLYARQERNICNPG